jgi:hypothetical protein
MLLSKIEEKPLYYFTITSVCPGGKSFHEVEIPIIPVECKNLPIELDAIQRFG